MKPTLSQKSNKYRQSNIPQQKFPNRPHRIPAPLNIQRQNKYNPGLGVRVDLGSGLESPITSKQKKYEFKLPYGLFEDCQKRKKRQTNSRFRQKEFHMSDEQKDIFFYMQQMIMSLISINSMQYQAPFSSEFFYAFLKLRKTLKPASCINNRFLKDNLAFTSTPTFTPTNRVQISNKFDDHLSLPSLSFLYKIEYTNKLKLIQQLLNQKRSQYLIYGKSAQSLKGNSELQPQQQSQRMGQPTDGKDEQDYYKILKMIEKQIEDVEQMYFSFLQSKSNNVFMQDNMTSSLQFLRQEADTIFQKEKRPVVIVVPQQKDHSYVQNSILIDDDVEEIEKKEQDKDQLAVLSKDEEKLLICCDSKKSGSDNPAAEKSNIIQIAQEQQQQVQQRRSNNQQQPQIQIITLEQAQPNKPNEDLPK